MISSDLVAQYLLQLIVFSHLFFSFYFPGRFPFYPREHLINHSPRYNWGDIRYLLRIFFFTCTVVTMLLRVLSSRVCACSDIWCHRNTSVKHKAWAGKVHFSVSRALISRAKGKHKENWLSRQMCTKNQTSIRSCQSVKGNKSREKENLKICFHKACLSTGLLLMYHYVLSFIKKVLRFSNIATYRLVWLFIRELSYEKSAEIRKETWCAHFARNSGSDTLLCTSLPEYMHRLITFLCRFFCLERWKKREM